MIERIEDKEPIFPISAAAKLLNISVHTLRMYEREGLIIPFKKESNQRLYSKSDLERIECIRKAINESKISINGIKTLYSLIPCWEVVKCSIKDRKNCKAYKGHSEPCWSYEHPKTICEKRDCRECDVYQKYTQCSEIKELIKSISR
ncbi:MAG: MerR family transcriptional regulator [Melioribacteraceae bacterium]